MVVQLAQDLIRTQDQLGPRDTENLVFKLFDQRAVKAYPTVQGITQNIGHAFIVGHAVNGIVGTANGVDGQQLIIGSGGLGASTLQFVQSENNTFVEGFRDQTYVDTSGTTATVNTTLFKVTATTGQILKSGSVAKGTTITNAQLYIPAAAILGTSFTYELSADGGSNWESVTLNTRHDFTNTGTDLRYRITAGATTSTLLIRQTDGTDTPLKVIYNE